MFVANSNPYKVGQNTLHNVCLFIPLNHEEWKLVRCCTELGQRALLCRYISFSSPLLRLNHWPGPSIVTRSGIILFIVQTASDQGDLLFMLTKVQRFFSSLYVSQILIIVVSVRKRGYLQIFKNCVYISHILNFSAI